MHDETPAPREPLTFFRALCDITDALAALDAQMQQLLHRLDELIDAYVDRPALQVDTPDLDEDELALREGLQQPRETFNAANSSPRSRAEHGALQTPSRPREGLPRNT
jgi:hypothetical protein